MRGIKQLENDNPTVTQLAKQVRKLVIQTNEQKEEIRQIKSKLRVNAHYSRQ